MNISFVTNARAPYRLKQFKKISEVKDLHVTIYYTDKNIQGRVWNIDDVQTIKEKQLAGVRLSKKYGYLNFGLIRIVRESDYMIIGGYEQPTYLLLSLLCRVLSKPYILMFDGISTDKLYRIENKFKKLLKALVINYSMSIWGNGNVSREYFTKKFNYDENKIINQCLTVDIDKIKLILSDKEKIRSELRRKYNIPHDTKIIMYSGRIIEVKNLKFVIDAINRLNEEILFFIAGGGEQKEELLRYSMEKGVQIVITGFIKEQEELFKHYSIADIFILSSISEVWGLVVNEAMAASLPVLVSKICGCSMDLVENGVNGYTFDPYDLDDLTKKMLCMINSDIKNMGSKSSDIISNWTFDQSRDNFIALFK